MSEHTCHSCSSGGSAKGFDEALHELPQHEQHGMRLPLVVTGDESTETTPATTEKSGGSVPWPGQLLALVALVAAALLAVRR